LSRLLFLIIKQNDNLCEYAILPFTKYKKMKNLDIKRINMLFGGGFQAFWEKPVNPQKETLRKLFVLFRKNEAKFKNAFGTAFCPNRCPKKSPKSPCYLR